MVDMRTADTQVAHTQRDAETLLAVENIETFYGPSQILFGLSLSVKRGELVALIGRNGMGKTTTIRSIMGLTPPRSGNIRFAGKATRGMRAFRIAQLGIGLVPEGRQIFPNLTVRENLIAAAVNRFGAKTPWTLERIHALFPRLAERGSNLGGALSGGEQQMLAVGRALMTNPKLLILDEATEGLAPLVAQEIWNTIAVIQREGISTIVVDKNFKHLSTIADRMVLVSKGSVVFDGTPGALSAQPELLDKHLGV